MAGEMLQQMAILVVLVLLWIFLVKSLFPDHGQHGEYWT
jgi:hypothetical protein